MTIVTFRDGLALAACNICFLKTNNNKHKINYTRGNINYIEVQKYPFGTNGLSQAVPT